MGPTELGLYVTRDAGQHWTPIPLPGGDGESQLSAVALVNGSIDHLHAWGTVTRDAEAIDATWEWSNKGDDSEWTQLDDPLIKPKVAPAMLGGDEFRPSPHGVLRVPAGGGKPTRLFPK